MVKDQVKQHIIETASQLFYRNGYNLTGINEVIRVADIAKATLYHHFQSKEDLCVAYLEYRQESFMKDLNEYVKKQKLGKVQILAVFGYLKSFFKQKQFNGCWCLNTFSALPKDHQKVKAVIQQQKVAFLVYLQQLVRANKPQLSKPDVKKLARRLYLLYESAIAESQLHQNGWPIEEAENMAKEILT